MYPVKRSDFEVIEFEDRDYSLRFHKGSLTETRGVGSVSRTLLKHFRNLSTPVSEEKRMIFFFSYFQWMQPQPLKNTALIIHDVSLLTSPEYSRTFDKSKSLIERAVNNAAKIATGTEYVRGKLIEIFGTDPDKIRVIPNPIERTSVAEPDELSLPNNPYILFYGASDLGKNLITLLKAFKSLPYRDLDLVVAGDNWQHVKPAEELGLKDRVHFVGRQDEHHLNGYIRNSVGVAVPSLTEGFSLTPFETALLDRPLVIADRPSLNGIISKDEALWCDALDVSQWVEKITCLRDGSYDKDMVRRLKQRTQDNFSGEIVARKYLDLFSEIE